ncbi:embryonic protein UVS.2-like [Rhinophrynus dorsalis]
MAVRTDLQEEREVGSMKEVGGAAAQMDAQSVQLPWLHITAHKRLTDVVQRSTAPDNETVFNRIINANRESKELLIHGDIAFKSGRSAINCQGCLWTKSQSGTVIVPYNLSPDYNQNEVALFAAAMQEFETLTCVRFVPRTVESSFLAIKSLDGCWSYMGRIGGAQDLSLGKYGCMYHGVIQHELNHALGFVHEQSRSDRDNYVTIMTQYISPEYQGNFAKMNTNNLGLEYDYSSVMHYGAYDFSNTSGMMTIVPKPDPTVPIGQRIGLSSLDAAKINSLYQCNVCRTLLSSATGTLMSANYPSPYPNNATCLWLIRNPSGQVSLKFEAFDVQSSSDCSSDYIKVYDGASTNSPLLLEKTCGIGQIPPLISSTNRMLVEFVSDASTTATGFKASYSAVRCGGTYYTPSRNITSPGYPQTYPSNMDCEYLITAPLSYKVSLSISKFNVEPGYQCKYDSLEVHDGDSVNAALMGKYCSTVVIPTLVSSGRSMLLKFHSDSSKNYEGFIASYTFVPSA